MLYFNLKVQANIMILAEGMRSVLVFKKCVTHSSLICITVYIQQPVCKVIYIFCC